MFSIVISTTTHYIISVISLVTSTFFACFYSHFNFAWEFMCPYAYSFCCPTVFIFQQVLIFLRHVLFLYSTRIQCLVQLDFQFSTILTHWSILLMINFQLGFYFVACQFCLQQVPFRIFFFCFLHFQIILILIFIFQGEELISIRTRFYDDDNNDDDNNHDDDSNNNNP